jgi:hypothetical protein
VGGSHPKIDDITKLLTAESGPADEGSAMIDGFPKNLGCRDLHSWRESSITSRYSAVTRGDAFVRLGARFKRINRSLTLH